MARTIIPKPKRPARGLSLRQVQKQTYNWLKFAHGDLDKADDMLNAEYYQGLVDAYKDVLWYMEQPPPNGLLVGPRKRLFALVPVALLTHHLITNYRKDTDADA